MDAKGAGDAALLSCCWQSHHAEKGKQRNPTTRFPKFV